MSSIYTILNYIINMLPFMLLIIPVYIIIRIIVVRKSKEFNIRHEVVLLVFVIFVSGLASQTVIPQITFGANGIEFLNDGIHETNLLPFKVVSDTYYQVTRNGNINSFVINVLGNIIMFMPIGFAIPLLWKSSNLKVILIGFSSSLFIEVVQLFLARGTDVDDLILNTLGTLFGLLIFRLISKKNKNFTNKFLLGNNDKE